MQFQGTSVLGQSQFVDNKSSSSFSLCWQLAAMLLVDRLLVADTGGASHVKICT